MTGHYDYEMTDGSEDEMTDDDIIGLIDDDGEGVDPLGGGLR